RSLTVPRPKTPLGFPGGLKGEPRSGKAADASTGTSEASEEHSEVPVSEAIGKQRNGNRLALPPTGAGRGLSGRCDFS
ncbi:MAG: hypothetical protein ABEJ58_03835, partial [Halodesulfurarchaeum sp.]